MVESFNVAAQRSTNGLGAATVLLMERVASSHEILSSVGVSQRTADTSREPINLPSTSQKVGSIASANLLQKETSGQLGQALKSRRGDGASTLPVGKTEVFVRGGSEGSSLASGIEVAKYKFNKVASFHASTTQKTINGMAKTANSPSNLGQKAVNAIGFSTKMEDRRVSTVDSEAQSGKKRHGDKIGDQKKKDKEKNKKKEKEKAKTSGEGEHKHKKPGDSKYGRKSDEIVNPQVKPSTLQTVNSTYHTGEKIKKRKEIEINGYRHESDIRPNKIQRTTPPHHHAENGRKLLSGVKPDCSAMEPELLKSNAEGQTNVDNKCMGNVIVEAGLRHPVSISTNTFSEVSLKPPRPDAKHLNREVSLKPPHPDAKYLGRIHYVPQMDEWPDYESQEWLFSGSKVLQKQRNMLEADETPEVWAEALRIEACDLLALPYVIPL